MPYSLFNTSLHCSIGLENVTTKYKALMITWLSNNYILRLGLKSCLRSKGLLYCQYLHLEYTDGFVTMAWLYCVYPGKHR